MKKIRFDDIWQVRRNFCKIEDWLKYHKKKTDLKCQSCKSSYSEIDDISMALATRKGKTNVHFCDDCAKMYIENGAEDIFAKIEEVKMEKQEIIDKIKAIGKWKKSYFNKRELEEYKIEELEKMLETHTALKEKEDRIDAIVISDEDAFIEQYLIDQYDVIQDTKYLKCEEQIEDYFKDDGSDLFDCGQGYCQDEANVIVKIAQKFYNVTIFAEIGSAKQDIGDRLYWVEKIEKVEWNEIPKPQEKMKKEYQYNLVLTEDEKNDVDRLLKKYIGR